MRLLCICAVDGGFKISKGNAYALRRAADCRPYGKYREIGAENGRFLRRKNQFCVFIDRQTIVPKLICKQSNILNNNPRIRTRPVYGVYILCGTNKSPANGKYIHSQGSFYYNVKMIKRSFCFHFVGAAICRPPKRQRRFP